MSRRAVMMSIVLGVLMAVAVPVSALAPPYEQLPDGDTRPIIMSAALLDPQPHNQLLESDLQIQSIDNDGILRYEYRWNRFNPGRVFATSAAEPTISYASVTPEAYARLEVRAVDLNGWTSAWLTVWAGITPSAPMIVLAVATFANIGLDALFILVLDLGLRGAAFATVASVMISVSSFAVLLLRRERAFVQLRLSSLMPSRAVLTPLLALAIPIAASMIVM